MKNPIVTLAFIALLWTAVPIARADDLTLETPARKLDPFIQSVSMCGHWKYHDQEGQYRIIYGWLWGHTEIYVQWVADPVWYPKPGQKERRVPLIVKTASFPDFDDYEAATDLENIRCSQQRDRWVITADADNGHEEDPKKSKYKLTIYLSDQPGKYKLVTKPYPGH